MAYFNTTGMSEAEIARVDPFGEERTAECERANEEMRIKMLSLGYWKGKKFIWNPTPQPPTYNCKHLAEGFANGVDSIDYICGSKNIKIIHDELFARTIAIGKLPTDHRTGGSTHLCQECDDVYHIAGGPGWAPDWHFWKADYDKRMAPPEAPAEEAIIEQPQLAEPAYA